MIRMATIVNAVSVSTSMSGRAIAVSSIPERLSGAARIVISKK